MQNLFQIAFCFTFCFQWKQIRNTINSLFLCLFVLYLKIITEIILDFNEIQNRIIRFELKLSKNKFVINDILCDPDIATRITIEVNNGTLRDEFTLCDGFEKYVIGPFPL